VAGCDVSRRYHSHITEMITPRFLAVVGASIDKAGDGPPVAWCRGGWMRAITPCTAKVGPELNVAVAASIESYSDTPLRATTSLPTA
jgi:hypothetical protein